MTEFGKLEAVKDEVIFRPGMWWVVAILVVVANITVYEVGFGIGMAMSLITAAWGFWWLLPESKKNKWTLGIAAVATVFGLGIGLRANGFVQSYDLVVSVVCVGMLLLVLINEKLDLDISRWMGSLWRVFIDSFVHTGMLFGRKYTSADVSGSRFVAAIKIAAIAVTLLVIFGVLLGNADPNFAKMLEELVNQMFGRIVFSVMVVVGTTWWLTHNLKHDEKHEGFSWLAFWEMIIPVGLVAIMVGGFLCFQTKYLFTTHEAFVKFPESYSDYVRRGFFELIAAALIGGTLAYGVWHKVRRQMNLQHKVIAQTLNVVWIAEIGLLLMSAWWRNMLYIQAYGFTRTRLIGEGFLIWVGGVMVGLLVTVIIKKITEKWLWVSMATMTILVGGYFNLVNMDMKIANRQPVRVGVAGGDYFYLANLSADAVVAWADVIKSAKSNQGNDREATSMSLALRTIYYKANALEEKYGTPEGFDIRKFNLAEYRAYVYMTRHSDLFYKNLEWQMQEYERREDPTERSYILNDFDYPFVNVVLRD